MAKKSGKNKGVQGAIKHFQKHPVGVLAAFLIVGGGIYIFMSKPMTVEQLNAEEGVKSTVSKFAGLTNQISTQLKGSFSTPASEHRKTAMGMWSTMTPFQREEHVKECLADLAEGDFKSTAKELGTTDMSRMFRAVCPDVVDREEFNSKDNVAWDLLDAWFKGDTISVAIMGQDNYERYRTVVGNGFWSGLDKIGFSKADEERLSDRGWSGIRGVVLGLFYRNFGANLLDKAERIAAGETDVLPLQPLQWSEEPEAQNVVHSTDESFTADLANKKHAIVMFYAPWCGHCKNFKPHFSKAADVLVDHGISMVGVDCTVEKGLAKKFNVTGYPTINYFVDGEEAGTYDGGRDAYGVVSWLNHEDRLNGALADIEDDLKPPPEVTWADEEGAQDVVHMTDETFTAETQSPHALVMFYAPWCGHCKAFKPDFGKAATAFKGQVVLGAVDATKHPLQAKEFDVKGYPTILYFKDGKMVEAYDGDRTAAGVEEWLRVPSRLGAKEEL